MNHRTALAFALALLLSAAAAAESIEVIKGVSVQAPRGWTVRGRTANSVELIRHGPGEGVVGAHTLILVENGRDHAEALRRLQETAREPGEKVSFRLIGGGRAGRRRR